MQEIYKKHPKHQFIFLGNYNAKIERNRKYVTGKLGLHDRTNVNGKKLVNFCLKNDLRVINSYFRTARKNYKNDKKVKIL